MSGKRGILIVEDDAALRALLAEILAREGWRVVEAGSKEEALAAWRAHPDVAIIILDLGLPPQPHAIDEGVLLLFLLRQEGFSGKVIVLTGQDQQRAAEVAIGEGAFDFLGKPATPQQILAAVARAERFFTAEERLRARGVEPVAVRLPLSHGWREIQDEVQEALLRRLWHSCGGNVSEVARQLGVKRENLYPLLKKFGIKG